MLLLLLLLVVVVVVCVCAKLFANEVLSGMAYIIASAVLCALVGLFMVHIQHRIKNSLNVHQCDNVSHR